MCVTAHAAAVVSIHHPSLVPCEPRGVFSGTRNTIVTRIFDGPQLKSVVLYHSGGDTDEERRAQGETVHRVAAFEPCFADCFSFSKDWEILTAEARERLPIALLEYVHRSGSRYS